MHNILVSDNVHESVNFYYDTKLQHYGNKISNRFH